MASKRKPRASVRQIKPTAPWMFNDVEVAVTLGPEFRALLPNVGDPPGQDKAVPLSHKAIETEMNAPKTRSSMKGIRPMKDQLS